MVFVSTYWWLIGACIGVILYAIWKIIEMVADRKFEKVELEWERRIRVQAIQNMIKLHSLAMTDEYFLCKNYSDFKENDEFVCLKYFFKDEKTQSSIISTGERVTFRTWEWAGLGSEPVFQIELKFDTHDVCVEVIKNTLKDLSDEVLSYYKREIENA